MLSPMTAIWMFGFGCVQGAIPAPYSARISGLEDATIAWSDSWNDEFDQEGAIVTGSLMVYDSETDLPLEHIEVEIRSGWQGAYLIPSEAVQLVGYPDSGTVKPTDEDAIRDACTDAEGNFLSDPEWCAWYWDTESQQFYQVGGQYIATSSNYAPNLMYGQTNNRGLLEFYIYVDQMPRIGGSEGQSYGSISFGASIGVDDTSWSIRTADSE